METYVAHAIFSSNQKEKKALETGKEEEEAITTLQSIHKAFFCNKKKCQHHCILYLYSLMAYHAGNFF
jgi:hypothetical protein